MGCFVRSKDSQTACNNITCRIFDQCVVEQRMVEAGFEKSDGKYGKVDAGGVEFVQQVVELVYVV